MNEFELKILDFIYKLRNPIFDFFFRYFTLLGDKGIGFVLVGILLLFFKKTRILGVTVLVAMLFDALIINVTLKPLIARVRPYELNSAVDILISKQSDHSFPSGHTGVAFAFAFAIFFTNKKQSVLPIVIASLMAFSRLYLYVHYPTDIAAGIVVGVLCGLAARLVVWGFVAKSQLR